jgi:hypothetical protein
MFVVYGKFGYICKLNNDDIKWCNQNQQCNWSICLCIHQATQTCNDIQCPFAKVDVDIGVMSNFTLFWFS